MAKSNDLHVNAAMGCQYKYSISEIVVELGIFSQLGCRVLARQRAAHKSWTALGNKSEGI